ncbi:calcineurin-like phosphoesterase C-terminal domain-containing protein [Luteococcus sp. OSA5]|uniref:calcineurin-like phosphoesterase C-terminal domain-containing protein n=1 Tax=Luteococcus sp. OSA5 TaxID=3401630 RepID=UPI003B436C72
MTKYVRTNRNPLLAGIGITAALGLCLSPAVSAEARPAEKSPRQTVTDAYTGHVEVVRGTPEKADVLKGTVFNDRNQDSKQDRGEKGIAGVTVSNGRDVVTTDGKGRYELPAFENMTVFVTQPAGWQVPVDENMIAQFSYTHLPKGSPDELKFGGLEPTGPLPKAVNFPLAKSKQTAKAQQNCPIASDTQIYNLKERGYAREGAVKDLMERTDYAACGILLLGDNVGDDLSLNDALKDLYKHANGPVRTVMGNHDMDYDATSDAHSNDTYRRDFGPGYYSYDVGQAHFVVLDSIEYPKPGGKARQYNEKISQEQLDWLAKDLANVPKNKKVIVATHAPIVDHRFVIVDNAAELYKVLEGRDVVTVGGHTHTLEHLNAGGTRPEWAKDGVTKLPFTQLIAGAVSGGWYGGGLDSEGLPYAFAPDGSRPGVMTLNLDGNSLRERYTVRGESEQEQMGLGLNTPHWRDWAEKAQAWQKAKKVGEMPELGDERMVTRSELASGESWLMTNFYAGSEKARVEVSIDGGKSVPAVHTQPNQGEELRKGWEYSDTFAATRSLMTSGNVPQSGSNIWRLPLPENLAKGTHQAEVTGTDEYGRSFTKTLRFTVVDERPSLETKK